MYGIYSDYKSIYYYFRYQNSHDIHWQMQCLKHFITHSFRARSMILRIKLLSSQNFIFTTRAKCKCTKVSFFVQCINNQLITLQNFKIHTCFSQFFWFFSIKCWFKGQMISRIHLILPNAYKLMCFD